MKNLIDVYNDAESKDLPIIPVHFTNKKAGIVHIDDTTLICADYNKFENTKEEKVCIAEEVAHYDTGSFYPIYSDDYALIDKAEYRARKKVYNELIPYSELLNKIKEYKGNIEELSEYFGVPRSDIITAFFCYTNIENYAENNRKEIINEIN